MKLNTYRKGQHGEREVEKLLTIGDNGYILSYKAPYVRFVKNHDIFNAWDLIAVKNDLRRVFIQVKTSTSGYSSAKKKLMAWVKMFGIETENYELWLYNGKRKPNKIFDCKTGKEKGLLVF
jgi:hypothetical protein